MARGDSFVDVIYEAVAKDDIITLEILKECGVNFGGRKNYVFTAVDCYARKSLNFLLKEDADRSARGQAYINGKCVLVEPIELAFVQGNIEAIKIFIENGSDLNTLSGIDLVRKYTKVVGLENANKIKELEALHKKEKEIEI